MRSLSELSFVLRTFDEQTVDDEPDIPVGASGTGARCGGAANLEASTQTHWVTIRGDITPYPF